MVVWLSERWWWWWREEMMIGFAGEVGALLVSSCSSSAEAQPGVCQG